MTDRTYKNSLFIGRNTGDFALYVNGKGRPVESLWVERVGPGILRIDIKPLVGRGELGYGAKPTIGYFTKYGDGAVDIMLLGNLVKGQVGELAGYLEIPQEIIHKPPSAGLWEAQTDEAEMGISYEALDNFILTGTVPEDPKRTLETRKAAGEHKCLTPPIARF